MSLNVVVPFNLEIKRMVRKGRKRAQGQQAQLEEGIRSYLKKTTSGRKIGRGKS